MKISEERGSRREIIVQRKDIVTLVCENGEIYATLHVEK